MQPDKGDIFDRPRPRAPRSGSKQASIRIRNRRRGYLDRHPEYFQNLDHELADPVLYAALVRKFQNPAERQADGRAKGYSRILEGDLLRGEARLAEIAALQARSQNGTSSSSNITSAGTTAAMSATSPGAAVVPTAFTAPPSGAGSGTITGIRDYEARDREGGLTQWREFLRDRFVQGADDDFDYARVDGDDGYDALETREAQDAWIEDEKPRWRGHSGGDDGDDRTHDDAGIPSVGKARGDPERQLEGETGVQDF